MLLPTVTLALAAPLHADVSSIRLAGSVDCDALQVLTDAVQDEVLTLEEVRVATSCRRTTPATGGQLALYEAADDAVQRHRDDPAALLSIAGAIQGLRGALVTDAVRLAVLYRVTEALEAQAPGPWQDGLVVLTAMEEGPQPALEPESLRRHVLGMGWWADADSVGAQARGLSWSAVALATAPLQERHAVRCQQALAAGDPVAELERLEDEAWGPWIGVAKVTADLYLQHQDLRARWAELAAL